MSNWKKKVITLVMAAALLPVMTGCGYGIDNLAKDAASAVSSYSDQTAKRALPAMESAASGVVSQAVGMLTDTAGEAAKDVGEFAGVVSRSIVPEEESAAAAFEKVELLWVNDGDTVTVRLDGKEERVRFIGIDTPESVNPDESKNTPEGKEASNFTKSFLKNDKYVYLEYDAEARDTYGRVLAYVYVPRDEGFVMLEEVILREGLAKTLTIPPNVKYSSRFSELQKEAREQGTGFWAGSWN